MPKILIRETDLTSPGTPESYANYSVLLAGFMGDGDGKYVAPDTNGVYEFRSADQFEKTIGLREPKLDDRTDNSAYHYGNRMAHELLNLGYTVVYKPIDAISDLADEEFWNIFRDKASYDFRFVSHGLLNSTPLTSTQQAYKDRLDDVKTAIVKLNEIELKALESVTEQTTNSAAELAAKREELYAEIKDEYDGFYAFDINTQVVSEVDRYASYASVDGETIGAFDGTAFEKQYLEELLADVVTEEIINEVNGLIANLAKYDPDGADKDVATPGRGDCTALIELDETSYTSVATTKPEVQIIKAIDRMSQINASNGKFCAMTVPSVVYADDRKFPGAFHYLACFINSLQSGYAEWYAAAGYTRGVSSYTIKHTTVKLGEIAINALEPRYITSQATDPKFACNVIANFRGSYYLWGNRTAEPLDAKDGGGDLIASHFLNIRQLCSTIKKQVYVACRRFTFDPNSDTLWINFVNAIRPTLDVMKADQGIRDYRVIKVFTDKKATLKAKIRIIPIEAVEDFDIEVSLEDSFGETAVIV